MQNTSKYLPWVLSAVLAVLWGSSWSDSKTAIEKKDAEIATLQQQYQRLVNDANKQVAEANTKIQQLADEANTKIQLANQPEIPVRVSFRKALLSSGNVASFNNISGQIIAVAINVSRASGQGNSFEMTLDPGMTKEIGEREGWAFIAGDTITVTQPEHKSKMFQAP
jgi:hypothetical protein